MNNHFNLSRFTALLRLILFQERKRVLLTVLASLGVALFLFLLAHSYENEVTQDKLFYLHQYFFLISLFFGGYLFAGSGFSALRRPVARSRYLTLPTSVLEKLAVYVLCLLLYPAVYLIAYWLFSVLANAVAGAVYSAFYRSFALEPEVRQWLMVLVLTQPIFLFGAATFRRIPLIQTFLYLSGLVALLVLSITFYLYGLNTGAVFFRRALYLAPYWLSGLALLFGLLTYGTLVEKEA